MQRDEIINKWKNWNNQRKEQEYINKTLNADIIGELSGKLQLINDTDDNKISEKLEKELEQNICGICLYLMSPPLRTPIILYPCGHTFCESCIKLLESKKCPICRTQIVNQAVNIALKNIIETYKNQKPKEPTNTITDNLHSNNTNNKTIKQYQKKIEELNTRYSIIYDELSLNEIQITQSISRNNDIKESITFLEKEKFKKFEQLKELQKDINNIDNEINNKRDKFESNSKVINKLKETICILKDTLQEIHEERCKINLFITENNLN